MKIGNCHLNKVIRIGMVLALIVMALGMLKQPLKELKEVNGSALLRYQMEQVAIGMEQKVWKQTYPMANWVLYQNNSDTRTTQEEEGSLRKWLLRLAYQMLPLNQYIEDSKSPAKTVSVDPAYMQYQKDQEFYQEYEYLASNNGTVHEYEISKNEEDFTELTNEDKGSTSVETIKSDSEVKMVGVNYSMEQLADFDFLMRNFYNIHSSTTAGRELLSASDFLSKDMKLTGTNGSPQVLIYHSHSQEEYADFHTGNKEATIVNVGTYLTELLESKGYSVIHDTTVYDFVGDKLDRNKAYTYALDGISSIIQQNPSIEVVIDLHRDGVGEDLHLVNEVNGKATAPIMFFNGLSQTPSGPIDYLENPYRDDNLAFSFQMQMKAAAYYPGLTRKIYLKGLRYNLHLRARSTLIEVGAQTNTYEEARNAMEPLAEILAMVLSGE